MQTILTKTNSIVEVRGKNSVDETERIGIRGILAVLGANANPIQSGQQLADEAQVALVV